MAIIQWRNMFCEPSGAYKENPAIKYSPSHMGNILLDKYIGVELFFKTMGVIGTGAIGSKVVKIAKGFSMDVLAYDLKTNYRCRVCFA